MKKIIPVMICGAILLSACNLPTSKATPDAADIQTRVAQTLTAFPTATSTQTVEPTSTPAPTATVTVTPTATISADDPKNSLGIPSFTDTFDTGKSFGVEAPYEDDAVHIEAVNGSLVFTSLAAQRGRRWRLTYPNAKNLYLEGTFTTTSCSGYDNYGLVLRAPDYSSGVGYYFNLACNGKISVIRWNSDGTHTIMDWTDAPTALTGSGQTNRLGIMALENEFQIYVNGTFFKSVSDDTIKDQGHYGVSLSAVENSSFSFKLDEINEWDR